MYGFSGNWGMMEPAGSNARSDSSLCQCGIRFKDGRDKVLKVSKLLRTLKVLRKEDWRKRELDGKAKGKSGERVHMLADAILDAKAASGAYADSSFDAQSKQ